MAYGMPQLTWAVYPPIGDGDVVVAVGGEGRPRALRRSRIEPTFDCYTTHLRCSCHHRCDDGGMEQGWPRKRSHTVFGSSLAFVIGATIMILLHETAHAATGALQSYHPTQLAFAVDYPRRLCTSVLAGALSIGVYAPMSMMFRTKQCDAPSPPSMPWLPVAGLISLGAFVVLNLLLTQGWFWP